MDFSLPEELTLLQQTVRKFVQEELIASSNNSVDKALQIHGGLGLTCDLPLERWFRDQRSRLITEGPSEIMRMMIARQVIRHYGSS